MPKYLETSADKFTFRVATDRLYTPEGVWVKPDSATGLVRIGVADYLQQHNGDVAFANVKPVDTRLAAGELVAEIETIKALVELQSPISGRIAEVNAALGMSPELINQSPYDQGWLAVIEPAAWESERPTLRDAAAYFQLMKEQIQKDLEDL